MPARRLFFGFFFVSGFCGLLYEVVWTRLAMASFGVTTAIVSVALSVFMLGLALGSWLGGARRLHERLRTGRRFLRAYALVELLIGTGAFLVPWGFDRSRALLLSMGGSDSAAYHLTSGLLLTLSMLPWATLMGTTFAFAMAALRTADGDERGFSYLYLANVLGAAAGTILTAVVLVELLGFHRTLMVAAVANAAIFAAAWMAARAPAFAGDVPAAPAPKAVRSGVGGGGAIFAVLFATGFTSMAMEVVWTRLFARYLGTFVYSFAATLAIYLLATFAGSQLYRRRAAKNGATRPERWWAVLGLLSVLPLVYADRRFVHGGLEAPWLVLCVAPFCGALGYLTPLLIDRTSGGCPKRASRAYGINVIGCIVGPLAAGYGLLPLVGERGAMALLAAVPLCIGAWSWMRIEADGRERRVVGAAYCVNVVLAAAIAIGARTYFESIPGGVVKRDPTATVVAYHEAKQEKLLVNGVGITSLTTITKVMAHLPLAHLSRPPRSTLAICFGMGTTFRSLARWDARATAVDLVPSVPALFGYFHKDAGEVLAAPGHTVVVDDGRRFLDRTREPFDVITIDPPPPVPAAGSSLLYSREFYQSVKRRLAPGGILQQWTPSNEKSFISSMAQSLLAEFKYVRAFRAIEAPTDHSSGYHFLASDSPIPTLSAAQLAARLGPEARADLVEWKPGESAESIFAQVLAGETDPHTFVAGYPQIAALTDDRPTNEYFILRWMGSTGASLP